MNKNLIIDVKNYVNYLMLPLDELYYHHYEHALSVMERAMYLATMEGCESSDIELLCIASLFHDTGFVIQYDNNENIGAKIAQNFLKTILYPEDKIKIIEHLILATAPEKEPKTLLEKIIKDADMDNLGREDFFDIASKLKHERETIKKIKIRDPDWHHAALDIIQGHSFYTPTQIKERNQKLIENTEELRKQLGE
ncbi:HD domain-containing protein [Candidatus Gracilibacteria bacterium]|nr:HD domain-containing protein [Candidatus Gracilibacteria bacterium]